MLLKVYGTLKKGCYLLKTVDVGTEKKNHHFPLNNHY